MEELAIKFKELKAQISAESNNGKVDYSGKFWDLYELVDDAIRKDKMNNRILWAESGNGNIG